MIPVSWFIDSENMVPFEQINILSRAGDKIIIPVSKRTHKDFPSEWAPPDVCNRIARFEGLEIIWHDSTFKWRGREVTIKKIGVGPQVMDSWILNQVLLADNIPIVVSHDYGYIRAGIDLAVYDANLHTLYGPDYLIYQVTKERTGKEPIVANMPRTLEDQIGYTI